MTKEEKDRQNACMVMITKLEHQPRCNEGIRVYSFSALEARMKMHYGTDYYCFEGGWSEHFSGAWNFFLTLWLNHVIFWWTTACARIFLTLENETWMKSPCTFFFVYFPTSKKLIVLQWDKAWTLALGFSHNLSPGNRVRDVWLVKTSLQ